MNTVKSVMISVLAFIISGCANYSEERKINDGFPETITLTPEKIKINEILKPGAMVLFDQFLVIQNEYNPGEDCFFVYTKNSLQFCYSFGRLGQSRTDNEFIAPRVIQNNTNHLFAVFDQATRFISYYKITTDSFVLEGKKQIIDNDKLPIQEMSFVNDSILLFRTTQAALCSYNPNTNQVIDKKLFDTHFKDELGANYNQEFDGFGFCNKGREIAVGFMFINKIIWGNLDENYYFHFEDEKMEGHILYPDQSSLYDNTIYYSYLSYSKKYIYAQYMGLPFKVFQPFPLNINGQYLKWLIEVYDWEKNKKTLIDLGIDMMRITVDAENDCIYIWDPLSDFDYLYKYTL